MTMTKRIIAVTQLLALLVSVSASALTANGTSGSITVLNANVSSGTATTGSTVALSLSSPQYATVFQDGDARYSTVGVQILWIPV